MFCDKEGAKEATCEADLFLGIRRLLHYTFSGEARVVEETSVYDRTVTALPASLVGKMSPSSSSSSSSFLLFRFLSLFFFCLGQIAFAQSGNLDSYGDNDVLCNNNAAGMHDSDGKG